MVSAARLDWISQQLKLGRQCRLRINPHVGRVVIQITLLTNVDPRMLNNLALSIVECLQHGLSDSSAVGHGHRNSKGESHISIIMKELPTAALDAGSGAMDSTGALAGVVPTESLGECADLAKAAQELSSAMEKLHADQEHMRVQVASDLSKTSISTQPLSEMTDSLLNDGLVLSAALTSGRDELDENCVLFARSESLVAKVRSIAGTIPNEIDILSFASLQEQVRVECLALIAERDQIIEDIEMRIKLVFYFFFL